MKPEVPIEVRPRTLGEILDDGWRLYLADPLPLLTVVGVVFVPAVCLLAALLTLSAAGGSALAGVAGWVLPVVVAVLLPCTGLTSGACQEAFHLWGEGQRASLKGCLRAVRRRWVNHVTCQAVMMLLPMLSLFCLLAPHWGLRVLGVFLVGFAVPVWMAGVCWQAVLTGGQAELWKAFRYSRRCSAEFGGKAFWVVAARLAFLAVGMLNAHLFLGFGVQVADELGGLDLGFLALILRPDNPAYLFLLGCLTWWLLTPYNEALQYLFYIDVRTRSEGLDLWYRIERHFPTGQATKAGAVLLLAGGWLLAPAPALAQGRAGSVRQAREDVAGVRLDIETATPYRGGQPYQGRLEQIGRRLDPTGNAQQGRYRWYFQAVERLGGDRQQDAELVRGIERRLESIEQSLTRPPRQVESGSGQGWKAGDIRDLVPGFQEKTRPKVEPPPEPEEPEEPPADDFQGGGNFAPSGPRVIAPSAGFAGLANVLMYFLFALIAAVVVLGVVLALRQVRWQRKEKPGRATGATAPAAEEYLDDPDAQNVQSLWHQADELARAGRCLEALRTLYLAVLAMLHQAHLIRYERTRTNGEYADQLRRRPALHPTFVGLTGVFEVKWYGERACALPDYQKCRDLADRLHEQLQAPAAEA